MGDNVKQTSISKKWGLGLALLFMMSVFTCLYLKVTLVYGLIITLTLAILILKTQGLPMKTSLAWVLEGIWSIKSIYVVVLLIGINVAVWISSGIVPSLIYYGFSIVDRVYFLLFAYLMTGGVAFFLGTGLGTLSTVGVALFALGKSIGMPSGILVGALMSGAYVADRLSPISALVNFTLETTEVKFKTYFKRTAGVMVFPAVLTAGLYLLLSLKYPSAISPLEIEQFKHALTDVFVISPFYFFIPVMVLWTSFKGMKSTHVLTLGILMSTLVTIYVQDSSILTLLNHMIFGFTTPSEVPFLKSLEIGGAFAMIEVVIIIMAGISMSTLFEKCGFIQPIIDLVERKSNGIRQVIFNTGLLSIVLNALTCDQTVGILVPGRYLKELFHKFKLDRIALAQVIANTGTNIAPLMPWNVNAIIVLAITGVSALEYAPYTFLNLLTLPFVLVFIQLTERR